MNTHNRIDMPRLVLIKHATPLKDPARPSHEWKLSDVGREQAAALAERLRGRAIEVVVTSHEPKARETGAIIAKALSVPLESAEGLEEHDRSNVPVMQTREFISHVAHFFKQRDELVLGRETANEAMERFELAVASVVEQHANQTIAIVSHGTVISLFLADRADEDAFGLWRRMGLPSYAVVSDDGRVTEIMDKL